MATTEQKKLKRDCVVDYVTQMHDNAAAGFGQLMADIRDKEHPANYDWRIDVWAHCLEQKILEPANIPGKFARRVAEKFLKGASERERDAKADIGTEVHGYIERLTNGEVFDIPENRMNHIRAWRQWCSDWEMTFEENEFTVFSQKYYYAGTGDFLGRSGKYPELGLICGDYKTSESGIWPDIALQVAAIKNADFIGRLDGTEDRSVLHRIDSFVGVQITAAGYKVVPIQVTQGTFQVFLAATTVARWKRDYEAFALDDTAEFVPLKELEDAPK